MSVSCAPDVAANNAFTPSTHFVSFALGRSLSRRSLGLGMAGPRCNSGPRAPLLRRSFDAFPADALPDPSMTAMAASSTHEVAVALPLMVSLVMTLATIVIEAIALVGILGFIRHHHRLGRTGVWFWQDVTIVSGAIVLGGGPPFGRDLHLGGGVSLVRSGWPTFSCLLHLRDALHHSGHR